MEGKKTSLSAGAKLPSVKGSKYNPTSENHINKVVSDARPVRLTEPIESAYFGSSENYGARDFYTSSLTMNTSETPSTDKKGGGNDLGSPNFATRGDWWQGSLYY